MSIARPSVLLKCKCLFCLPLLIQLSYMLNYHCSPARFSLLAASEQGRQEPAKPAGSDFLSGDDAKSASELVSALRPQPEGTPSAAAFTAVDTTPGSLRGQS